jgi:hypothetical protein
MSHVMSRGDRCENIFLDNVDRQDFLKTLAAVNVLKIGLAIPRCGRMLVEGGAG